MKKLKSYKDFVLERRTLKEAPSFSFNESLILEGGAAGHMSHPFDNKELTFGDFKKLIQSGLSGELNFEEEPTEKTDGQNQKWNIIGFCTINHFHMDLYKYRSMISQFFILNPYQRRGFGLKLLEVKLR